MKNASVVAKTVLQDQNGLILLIRRSKTAPRRPLEWDLPGGFVEDGENFTDAAIRETEEEVGIKLSKDNLHLSYTYAANMKFGNVCWLFFVAKTKENKVQLSHEHDKYQWLSVKNALEIIEYKLHRDLLTYLKTNNLID